MSPEWRSAFGRGLGIAAVSAVLLGYGVWQGQRLADQDAGWRPTRVPRPATAPALPPLRPDTGITRARMNGGEVRCENGMSDLSPEALVRSYQRKYRGQSVLAELTPAEQAEHDLVDGVNVVHGDGFSMLGFIDRDGRSIGVVAFTGPEGRGSRYSVFTGDDALAQVPTQAGGGDVPGRDLPDCPRPPGARRVLALEPDAESGRILLYETAQSPAELARWYRAEMPRRGWSSAAAEAGAGTLRDGLAFVRPGRECRISAEIDEVARRTLVTLVQREGPGVGATSAGGAE
ncbi:MAG: hypothetical protein HZA54_15005 [Planctomycetes bacterium]|nr:hypothetical protein [Planctomycetota bacterium]